MTPASNTRDDGRFLVKRFDGRGIAVGRATWSDLLTLDPRDADYFESEPQGLLAFLASDGAWRQVAGSWARLGPVRTAVLHTLQSAPGIFYGRRELVAATRRRSLTNDNTLAAHVMRLREALGEKGATEPRFIETRRNPRYGVRWPRDRTWILVEWDRAAIDDTAA